MHCGCANSHKSFKSKHHTSAESSTAPLTSAMVPSASTTIRIHHHPHSPPSAFATIHIRHHPHPRPSTFATVHIHYGPHLVFVFSKFSFLFFFSFRFSLQSSTSARQRIHTPIQPSACQYNHPHANATFARIHTVLLTVCKVTTFLFLFLLICIHHHHLQLPPSVSARKASPSPSRYL